MLPKPTWGILGILGGRAVLATYNHLKFSLSSQHKEKHNPVLKTEPPFLPHSMKVNVIEAKMVGFFFSRMEPSDLGHTLFSFCEISSTLHCLSEIIQSYHALNTAATGNSYGKTKENTSPC